MAGKKGIPLSALDEQISMYMAALPCPPMPLIVSQESADDLPKEAYSNSHDLIATLLRFVITYEEPTLHKQRREKQEELTAALLTKRKEANQDLGKAYSAFSEFTSGYICAFANIDVCVKFMPLDHVQKDDVVHKACCSWHRAQEVLAFKAMSGLKVDAAQIERILARDFSHVSYEQLLRMHCTRFFSEPGGEGLRGG